MNFGMLPLPLPTAPLWAMCPAQERACRLMGKRRLLMIQKAVGPRALGWVWTSERLEHETHRGLGCNARDRNFRNVKLE